MLNAPTPTNRNRPVTSDAAGATAPSEHASPRTAGAASANDLHEAARAVSSQALRSQIVAQSPRASHTPPSSPFQSRSPSPIGVGLHGDLDQNMAAIHAQFLSLFRRHVSAAAFEQAQPVLQIMNDTGASFESRRQIVDKFIAQHRQTDPKAITDLVKMLDCQLLVYGVAERAAAAAPATPPAPPVNAIDASIDALAVHCDNDPQQIRDALGGMTVASVFTAHPTNLHDPESIMGLLAVSEELHDPVVLENACKALWQSSGGRGKRPSVQEEAQHNAPHLQRMQREIRRIHKSIDRSVDKYGSPAHIDPLLQVDSWIGGDRDGNVLVNADVIKDVMTVQANVALDRYVAKLGGDRLQKSGSFRSLMEAHAPGEAEKITERIESTRRKLSNEKLATLDAAPGYDNPQALVDHLETLRAAFPEGVAQGKLSRFTREIGGAGFHAASVDVRQNSSAHETTVNDLMREAGVAENYAALPEADKQAACWKRLLASDDALLRDPGKSYSANTSKELAIFEAIRDTHEQFGEKAMPTYIIANTETVSDILEPMVLLKEVGLVGSKGLKMNIVPLIETVPDLKKGREIVGTLLQHPQYRQWLKERGNTQQIMVGYSDSNRLDGPLSSNWEIQKALVYLQDIAHENGVELLVFHGRGGTVARGAGADPEQEVDMMPGGAARRGLRHTEQGEEIAIKYGTPKAARQSLQALTAAVIGANVPGERVENRAHHAVMEQLSDRSSEVYRALIAEPGFIDYYNQATPVGYVPHLNAGSRAASRTGAPNQRLRLDQLRAIPWVASWNQSRAMVPAWFGMGTAIGEHVQTGPGQQPDAPRMAQLREMYQEWPFFQHLVDRTEGELAKADLGIVKHYAGLVQEDGVGEAIHTRLEAEFNQTCKLILAIKGSQTLLENNPEQAANLARKAPLLDTANALQIGLIDAERNAVDGESRQELLKGVVGSMQAIQSGLGRFG